MGFFLFFVSKQFVDFFFFVYLHVLVGFSWNKLLQKELIAPWIPKLKNKQDTALFEPPEEAEHIKPYHNDDPSGWEKDFGPWIAGSKGNGAKYPGYLVDPRR